MRRSLRRVLTGESEVSGGNRQAGRSSLGLAIWTLCEV
jgi:hypothetical protein